MEKGISVRRWETDFVVVRNAAIADVVCGYDFCKTVLAVGETYLVSSVGCAVLLD